MPPRSSHGASRPLTSLLAPLSAGGAIGDLLLVYKKVQRLAGLTARVSELLEALERMEAAEEVEAAEGAEAAGAAKAAGAAGAVGAAGTAWAAGTAGAASASAAGRPPGPRRPCRCRSSPRRGTPAAPGRYLKIRKIRKSKLDLAPS